MSETILDYIGLNINRVSKNIKGKKPQYNTAKAFDNSALYKVYKKIPASSIEILISDTDRTTDIKERYDKSVPIEKYIKENKDSFLSLVENTSIESVKQLEDLQDSFSSQIPFFIKYDKNYLWQIYYSQPDDKYFMLFPSKEGETEVLFYMLKQKLSKEEKSIYVPICKEDYSGEIVQNEKLKEIENYIWMFTSTWPQIYEVEDKDKRIYLTGQIRIHQDFTSSYRIELKNKDDADVQYTLFKALYLIATETKGIYRFTPQIDKNGGLTFYYNNEEITVKNIKEFITTETAKQQNLKYEYKNMLDDDNKKLEKLKDIINKQTEVYARQEKQIATFMNCRKSFFKKVRFFFTNNKKLSVSNKQIIESIQKEVKDTEENSNNEYSNQQSIKDMTFSMFTISDLVNTSLETKNIQDKYKLLKADIKALELKQTNMEHKIENAQIYIDEIEQHKKSLLDFWRFTNKDNQNVLNKGQGEVKQEKKQISFNLNEDFVDFSVEVDDFQRKKLSKDECDAIFVAKHLLPGINSVTTRSDTYILDEEYEELKKQFNEQSDNTSIFGNLTDDYTKVKMLNNKKHRESNKNLFAILRFNEYTTLDDFKERMREIGILVNEAYQKLTAQYDMTLYYSKRNKGYIVGDIDPYKILRDKDIKKIYKMQTSKDTHLIYFSNIMFFDNKNKTLPLGMDKSTEFITKVGENRKISDVDLNLLIQKDLFNVEIRKIKLVEEGKRN